MRIRTALFGLALSALTTVGLAPAATADEPGIMIIGGEYATDAPWVARLFIDGQQFCVATMMTPTILLTAEHCVAGLAPSQVTFRIGSLDQFNGGELATAVDYTVNPEADIAVVVIDHPVETEYVSLGEDGDAQPSDLGQVYGWGATCTDRPEIECQSQFLKVAEVRVNSIGCEDYRGGVAICARAVDGVPAGGDSGGPMFVDGKQVGVGSTSDRKNRMGYTSVIHYRDWITSVSGV